MNMRPLLSERLGLKLLLSSGLVLAGCPDDGGGDSDSGTDTSSTTDTPTTDTPTTGTPTTDSDSAESSSSTDPDTTDTDPDTTDTDTDTAGETDTDTTGVVGCGVMPGSSTWDAPDWDDNTTTEAGVRELLAVLAANADGTMRSSETTYAAVSVGDLEAQFAMGDPSLEDVTHAGFLQFIELAFSDFAVASVQGEEDFMTLDPNTWDPPTDGGVWGSSFRNMNVNGIESRQIIDKGLFSGGAFYWHAATLTEGTIDAATIDQIAYIFGMDPSGEPLDMDGNELVGDAAGYAFDQGFHADAVQLLADAKAYAADPECTAELDTAVQDFFTLWELAMMSRAVYYYNAMLLDLQAAEALDETSADPMVIDEIQDTYASGLHLAAEGIGLQLGFYGMPEVSAGPLMGQTRIVADEDIEAMMEDIGLTDLTNLRTGTFGAFCNDSTALETAQNDLAGVLQEVYPIDASDIADWRSPTAG